MKVPELLQIPDKLKPLVSDFNDYRYFLAEGGRGGGKSQAIGRLLLYLGEKYELRIVCGREIQNSVEESVYTVLVDLIKEHNLTDWEIFRDRLEHVKSGTAIRFKGFREQGRVSIKGLEGVDILWIDEAQSIVKNTLEIIIPTIRKEKAKVLFSMNRYLKSDAVYKEFATREDCLHMKINYMDNPYCPDALKMEAELMKERSPEDYAHVWLGEPREEADDYLFNHKELEACKFVDFIDRGTMPDTICAWDVARYGDDRCVGVVLERLTGVKYRLSHIERWAKKSTMETVGRIMNMRGAYKPLISVVDGDGLGGGVYDRLEENGVNCIEFRGGHKPKNEGTATRYLNLKAESYFLLKELIMREYIQIEQESILEELSTIRYKVDSAGRYSIVSKEDMKKKGIKSPDEADALMMAVSEIHNIGESLNIERNQNRNVGRPAYATKEPLLRRF